MEPSSERVTRSNFGSNLLLTLSLIALAIIIGTRTISRGDDFKVFWNVARGWREGVSPYDFSRFGNMLFKYPPWWLPPFLPLGWMRLATAKAVWGAIEGLSLISFVRRSHTRLGVSEWSLLIVLWAGFGILGIHGLVGQISLPLLAIALWAMPGPEGWRTSGIAQPIAVAFAFSAKVVTLFPLVGVVLDHPKRLRIVAASALAAAALSLPLLTKVYGGIGPEAFARLFADWSHAMFSGTTGVNSVRIGFTTREAQGFPSLLLRYFPGADETKPAHVLAAVAVCFAGVAALWRWLSSYRWGRNRFAPGADGAGGYVGMVSGTKPIDLAALRIDARGLSGVEKWVGWLALTPVVQPLAWFHFYVFAFPVAFVAVDRSFFPVGGRKPPLARRMACVVGLLFLGAITEKTLGSAGLALEMLSIKSWGVLLLVWAAYAPFGRRSLTGA